MSGNSALLDSNVIIDNSKGIIHLNKILENYQNLYVSIISYVEILGFKFKNHKEITIIENIFENLPIINLDLDIANIAINYRKIKKIKLADSLIIATAKNLGSDLITSNVNDFSNIDITLKVIDPHII